MHEQITHVLKVSTFLITTLVITLKINIYIIAIIFAISKTEFK